jgi:hypothetical protein
LIFYGCGFRSSKTFPNENSELVQPFLTCSAIIFELIGPIQPQTKHQIYGTIKKITLKISYIMKDEASAKIKLSGNSKLSSGERRLRRRRARIFQLFSDEKSFVELAAENYRCPPASVLLTGADADSTALLRQAQSTPNRKTKRAARNPPKGFHAALLSSFDLNKLRFFIQP